MDKEKKDFKGVDLTGVEFDDTTIWPKGIGKINETNFQYANLEGSNFENANLMEDIGLNRKIQKKLVDIYNTGREPKIIVMHPETWAELIKEFRHLSGKDINYISHYKGIRVLRSIDLVEGEFEIN